MAAINKYHKNGYHGCIITTTDLQLKPNITKFAWIFHLNMLLAILDGSNYQKSQKKWLPWLYVKDRLEAKTYHH